jgi:hypothetical protein
MRRTPRKAPDDRIMANSINYSQTYSDSSAGQTISAKGRGDPLADAALLYEFRNHANIWNREPTALVSVSSRIVDTLKRAFDKCYENDESPQDIWIAFIEVPPAINNVPTQFHLAQVLAEKCKLSEPNLFYHELVFEWAIPEKYVIHKVFLQTLMDRGIQRQFFHQSSTAKVQRFTAGKFQHAILLNGSWDISVRLSRFARA